MHEQRESARYLAIAKLGREEIVLLKSASNAYGNGDLSNRLFCDGEFRGDSSVLIEKFI